MNTNKLLKSVTMQRNLVGYSVAISVMLGLVFHAHAQPARPQTKSAKGVKVNNSAQENINASAMTFQTNKVVAFDVNNKPVGTNDQIIVIPASTVFQTNKVITFDPKDQPVATNLQIIAITSVTNPVLNGKIVLLLETNPPLSILNNHVVLNSGVILLNPYRLTTNGISGDTTKRRRLENSDGTQAKFFVDLAVNYVWAWDTDRRYRFVNSLPCDKDGVWFWHQTIPLDFQGHLSYYANDGKQTTASAIVGSGNFGCEFTVGLPIYRSLFTAGDRVSRGHLGASDLYDDTLSVHWFGLVGSYSAVTDSGAFDLHDRFLLGVGYRAAYKTPFETAGTSPREVVLNFTAGAAGVDAIRFLNDDTKEIQLHHEDVPEYHLRAVFALETEVYYPITKSLSAIMGARLYAGMDPNTWNAYFGLTVPLDKIADILK